MAVRGRRRSWLGAAGCALLATACTGPNPAWKAQARPDGPPALVDQQLPGLGGAGGDAGGGLDAPGSGGTGAGGAGAGGAGGGGGTLPPVGDGPTPDRSSPDLAADSPAPDAPGTLDPRLSQGLVGHWRFDRPPASGRTLGDDTGTTGNTAQLNMVTWSDDNAPNLPASASSLQFDGTGYVDVSLGAFPRSEGPKTIALWWKATSATPTVRTLVALATASEMRDLGVQVGLNGTQLAAWRYGRTGPEVNAAASLDVWQHGVYTFSGDTHRLYVNGRFVRQVTGLTMRAGLLDRAMLGSYDPPDEMFQGLMNDLRVYNRVLGDDEIELLAYRP